MQRLAAMAFDGALPPHNGPSQSQSGLLPSPDIRSGNSGLNSRPRESSDDHDHQHVDVDAMKTQEVKGVWEPVVDDDDVPPPPPPKLRARSNSAADLLTSSRMAGQEYQFQHQPQQHQYQQQNQQRWPPQYTDLDDRDIAPPPPPGMRGRSSSAADLLGLGLGGRQREMAGYGSGYESQQYQPHSTPHSAAAPFFHATTSTSSFDAHDEMYTRPPLHKSASASILRSTPSPLGLGLGNGHGTTPRMPSRPPPPPPKSKAMMMRIQTGFRGVDGAAVGARGPASPASPSGGGVSLAAMLGPASGDEQESEGLVGVDGDEEAVVVEAEEEDEDEEEEEEDYGVVVSRPHNRMVDESYSQQQQYAPPPPHTPTTSPRLGMTTTSPNFPSAQAIKVENALMALAPALPSLSSPHLPPYGSQYYHPNESSSSSDGNQQQMQGRGLSLTTRLRSMSSLGNLHVSPTSPASVGSPPLSALSSASPTGPPTSPTVLGNNKESVSGGGKESGGKSSGGGGALSTLLLGIQKKAPKRKLVVSGVAMEDVDAYEAVKRWCEVGRLLSFFIRSVVRYLVCAG